jgi:hypothetical protein
LESRGAEMYIILINLQDVLAQLGLAHKNAKILFLGLDNAGKTVCTYVIAGQYQQSAHRLSTPLASFRHFCICSRMTDLPHYSLLFILVSKKRGLDR